MIKLRLNTSFLLRLLALLLVIIGVYLLGVAFLKLDKKVNTLQIVVVGIGKYNKIQDDKISSIDAALLKLIPTKAVKNSVK